MENNNLNDLFQRYLENRCTPQELKLLLNHFRQADDETQLREMIARQLAHPVDTGFEQSPEGQRMFADVHRRIHRAIRQGQDSFHQGERAGRVVRLWPKVAVAAAVILIVGFSWLHMELLTTTPQVAVMLEVATQNGQQQEVTLPDGSRVFLNAGSEFTYPEHFEAGPREVFLHTGEGYFEVNSDPDTPFVIRAGEMDVHVLGTSFNVKAYREDESSRIAVSSGEVEVRFGFSQPVSLHPRQQVVWDKPAQQLIHSEIEAGDIGAWRSNRMVFDNETLAEVFRVLERHHNIGIHVESPELLQERVTLKLNEQPLTNVLETLSFTKQFDYEMDSENETVTVIKK